MRTITARIVLLLALTGLGISPASACFGRGPPTSEVTELGLPRISEPSVVFNSQMFSGGRFAIRVTAEVLLAELLKPNANGGAHTYLAKVLQQQMPLKNDLNTNEISRLAYPPPKEVRRMEESLERFIGEMDVDFRYAIAELLDKGQAAVVDLSSGNALISVVRDTYTNRCGGGRKYQSKAGEEVLHVIDGWS